jgi:hypothetical protein
MPDGMGLAASLAHRNPVGCVEVVGDFENGTVTSRGSSPPAPTRTSARLPTAVERAAA